MSKLFCWTIWCGAILTALIIMFFMIIAILSMRLDDHRDEVIQSKYKRAVYESVME